MTLLHNESYHAIDNLIYPGMAVPHLGTPPRSAPTAHPKLAKSKSESLRRRIFAAVDSLASRQSENSGATLGEEESEWESEGKAICTTPGMACAGETETETDEPVGSFFWIVCCSLPD